MKHITKKQALLGVFSFFMVGTLSFLMTSNMKKSDATMAGFSAGNIISDYVMGNYNSMNESQIQAFLKSKNSCNDTGTYKAQQYPNYSYHIVNGHFVCMADENFNGESAAHIIYRAAQDYHINPQVLIVLLQKEQGLVTDTWPNSVQYRSATGYGCPDTAACDSQYYGLKNQIRNAAELYRWILDHGSKYYPVGWNNVRFSPNAACGSSRVNIENNATAALYQYTPYQPNAAAINAGYGTGDACSAYGNRNFYNYFTDWFGDTRSTYSEIDIPNGIYYFKSAISNSKVLDVDISSSNVQIYDSYNNNNQSWKIKRTSDGFYNIINMANNKLLDVVNAGISNETNIQVYNHDVNTCAQKWKFIDVDGYVSIRSACSHLVLDVKNGSISNGNNIQLYTLNTTNAQKWEIVPKEKISDGLYTINSSISESKVIDITNGVYTAQNNTNVQLYENNNTAAQHWYIKNIDNDFYSVTNPSTGKSLDVINSSKTNGSNIQIYSHDKNTCAQKWRILKDENDNITFISACSYKVIDLRGGIVDNGTNIQLYAADNVEAQKWKIKTVDSLIDQEKEYSIISVLDTSKAIDITGGAEHAKNGTNIQLYAADNVEAQKWKINYDEELDSYNIINVYTKKAIDVSNANTFNKANVQLYAFNNTCAQRWHIIEKNNHYIFLSSCSGKAIDVTDANTFNGVNIQIYQINNNKAQEWILKENN